MRFTVVIPTYNRRATVLRALSALGDQTLRDFEVVVAVDGSVDGTAEAIRATAWPFPVTIVAQANQGAAVARNAGAAAGSGELLLFLDDDMRADRAMLQEHDRLHRDGADLVLGDVPLDPESPPAPIAAVTGRWAERRRARLERSPTVPVMDLLTGQLSVARATFSRLGGFDAGFTRGGRFGGEDLDFGIRAERAGLRIVFNPAAVSYQHYDVDAATYTRRSRDVGRADRELAGRYPELAGALTTRRSFASRGEAAVFGTLARLPAVASAPLRWLAASAFSSRHRIRGAHRLFFAVQTMEYRRGVSVAERSYRRPSLVVLAYHALTELTDDRVLRPYGIAPERFAAQLDVAARRGWSFVSIDDVLGALEGGDPLPARAVLVTFDDGYTDLLDAGAPILAARGIPAVCFAVSERVGGVNDWERRTGVTRLPLLDVAGLRRLAAYGIAVGSHTATHRPLTELTPAELDAELRGAADRLERLGLPRPVTLSYPYGEWSPEVASAVAAGGYRAAFTVEPAAVTAAADPFALPRIEVFAADTPRTLVRKLRVAGWRPAWRRRAFRILPGPRS